MKTTLLFAVLFSAAPFCATAALPIGPFGGAAAIVQADPHRPGTLIAATTNALMFQSSDSGESWTRLPFPAELRGLLHAFVVAPDTGLYLAALESDDRRASGLYA